MDVNGILKQLCEERDKLDVAIEALEKVASTAPRRRGRPRGSVSRTARGPVRATAAAREPAAGEPSQDK